MAASLGGCFLITAFWRSPEFAMLASLAIVVISALVKQWYVQVRTGEWVLFKPLMLGSLFSSLVLFFVPVWVAVVPVHAVVPKSWPIRHQDSIAMVTLVCCGLIYAVVFCFKKFQVVSPERRASRGFEVITAREREGAEAGRN